jgi:hypothetical protein
MLKRLFVALALILAPTFLFVAEGGLGAQTTKKPKKEKMKKPKKEKMKKPKKVPATGKVYVLRPEAPKWMTADVEFRGPTDDLWPNFFYGRPATVGTFTYGLKVPKASFVLFCDRRAQRNGDQSQRVLGELLEDNDSLTVKLTVRSLAKVRTEDEETTDSEGRTVRRPYEFAPFKGTLEVGDRQVDVNGKLRYRFSEEAEGAQETVFLDLRFKVKAGDLGLSRISGNLECRAGAMGTLRLDGVP